MTDDPDWAEREDNLFEEIVELKEKLSQATQERDELKSLIRAIADEMRRELDDRVTQQRVHFLTLANWIDRLGGACP